jgi:hypothetical protein
MVEVKENTECKRKLERKGSRKGQLGAMTTTGSD